MLIRFFRHYSTSQAMTNTEGDTPWPESRFKEVARRHRIELEEMHVYLLGSLTKSNAFLSSPMRKQLGEQIGAAIRFQLRRLFNPVPYTPTNTDSTKFPQPVLDYSNCRSRVYQLVRMVGESDERDTPVADGSISSVFNLAIRYIFSYFDVSTNTIVAASNLRFGCEEGYNCHGEKSGSYNFSTIPTDYDLDSIVNDIKSSHDAIATGRACKFVTELLGWPGVQGAINDAGGWGPVEELASILTKHNLENVCPELAHFQILKDMNSLTETLRTSMTTIEATMPAVEESLGELWKRFNCGKATWLFR